MRLNRLGARRIAGLLAMAAALVSPLDTLAQGDFFDDLFGPEPYSAYPARRSGRVTHPRPRPRAPKAAIRRDRAPEAHAEEDSMSGGGYCVRACDGYYFPLIKSSLVSGQHSCELACPSARVELYEGESIEDARNAKGGRYSALPVAFSFRDKLTAGCSCNDPATSHNYFLRLSRRDPTLRDGDVVIGQNGAFIYSGSSLVSLSRASRHIRARLRNVLPRRFAPKDASVSLSQEDAFAWNKTQRRAK
ncbi:DUF2865 domain-containing protein [Methylocystis sp.]|uniref:DUF2865 domain-containing protein n=1 Tax=Methylocystis sp. TaxID=1911079 RepID=UPI003D0F8A9B